MNKTNINICPSCKKLHNGLFKCGVCGSKVCINCLGGSPVNPCKKCRKEIDAKMNFDTTAEFEKGIISGGSIRG